MKEKIVKILIIAVVTASLAACGAKKAEDTPPAVNYPAHSPGNGRGLLKERDIALSLF